MKLPRIKFLPVLFALAAVFLFAAPSYAASVSTLHSGNDTVRYVHYTGYPQYRTYHRPTTRYRTHYRPYNRYYYRPYYRPYVAYPYPYYYAPGVSLYLRF